MLLWAPSSGATETPLRVPQGCSRAVGWEGDMVLTPPLLGWPGHGAGGAPWGSETRRAVERCLEVEALR